MFPAFVPYIPLESDTHSEFLCRLYTKASLSFSFVYSTAAFVCGTSLASRHLRCQIHSKGAHAWSRRKNTVQKSWHLLCFREIAEVWPQCKKHLHIFDHSSNKLKSSCTLSNKRYSTLCIPSCNKVMHCSCAVQVDVRQTESESSTNVEQKNPYTEYSSFSTSPASSTLALALIFPEKLLLVLRHSILYKP